MLCVYLRTKRIIETAVMFQTSDLFMANPPDFDPTTWETNNYTLKKANASARTSESLSPPGPSSHTGALSPVLQSWTEDTRLQSGPARARTARSREVHTSQALSRCLGQ